MASRTPPRPVLVVDDDPACRRLVAISLRELGFETIEASTAREWLRRAGRVAAIVIDYSMAGATGLRAPDEAPREGLVVPLVLTSSLVPSGHHAPPLQPPTRPRSTRAA